MSPHVALQALTDLAEALEFTSCSALGSLLIFSESQFPDWKIKTKIQASNKVKMHVNTFYKL